MNEAQREAERLESELNDFRHLCRLDWRELHQLEQLIDLKIRLALARQADQSTGAP